MASNSETGHAVNISNFKLMIDKCAGFGAACNPSNPDITVASMTAKWTAADTAHATMTAALQGSKGPVNAREELYKPTGKLVTRVLNIANSTKASKQLKKDAKGLADRFRGFGVKVKYLPDGTPDPSHVSTSHQSYVQKADTFKQLVDLLEGEPLYAPNEAMFTIATLRALSTQMKTANDNIGTILAPVDNARIARDRALYDEEDGVLVRAAACKDYVQGASGFTSAEAKLVTKIRFTKPKKQNP